MTVTYTIGDTRDVIATIPDGSISLIATSPPFIALRSYLPADHPDKHAEIGSEPDPATFIDTMLELTAEWGRVLAPWGSIAIELGDTYSGASGWSSAGDDSWSNGDDKMVATGWRSRPAKPSDGNGWPRAKCLALVPQAYALSLAYGRNVLTGQPSPAGQWLVRNVITWHRPNPAVGALGDKYRPSTSQIVVATRSAKRWFDLTAVRGEPSPNTHARTAVGVAARATTGKTAEKDGNFHTLDTLHLTAGAPPLDAWFDEYDGTTDTWTLTTQPSKLAHYAMWPAKLAERLILSMCPAEVCTSCGEPRRRVEKVDGLRGCDILGAGNDRGTGLSGGRPPMPDITRTTLGWTDCGCQPTWIDLLTDIQCTQSRMCFAIVHELGCPLRPLSPPSSTMIAEGAGEAPAGRTPAAPSLLGARPGPSARFRPGVVLDPFAGTGTTLAVADLHGRDAIGIDIDARNQQLYEQRRAECARNLFDSPMPDANQLDLFGGVA